MSSPRHSRLKAAISTAGMPNLAQLAKGIQKGSLPGRLAGRSHHLEGGAHRRGQAESPDQRDHLPRDDLRHLEGVLEWVQDGQVLIYT